MGLNIKNEEVHRLARELAKRTGETMTSAIQAALEERLARLAANKENDRKVRAARVRAILDSLPPVPPGVTSNHDDLYDEFGLPK
ncbi:MAG: type II toxin-antitoxin system VapB family antitoxin [Rhizobiaceae bacterium]